MFVSNVATFSCGIVLLACAPACRKARSEATSPPVESDGATAPADESAAAEPESEAAPEAEPKPLSESPVVVDGALSEDAVKRVFDDHSMAVNDCFDGALQRMAVHELNGEIVIDFEIDGSGAVIAPKVKSETFDDDATAECLVRLVGSLSFPKAGKGKKTTVSYPLALRSY